MNIPLNWPYFGLQNLIYLHACWFFRIVLCSPLYDEVITLCVDLGERDAAIAIVADLEAAGINVPDETLDNVLREKPIDESDMQQNIPTDEVQAWYNWIGLQI